MSDYDVIMAMLARMEAAEDGRKCPDEGYGSAEHPSLDEHGDEVITTVEVDGDRVLLVPGGYQGFYSRLRFDEDGRLVGWGSYE